MGTNNYIPAGSFKVDPRIPDRLPDYTQPVYTPKNSPTGPIPSFKQEMTEASIEFYDDPDYPDYTAEVQQGMKDILNERPQLTRSEAEEQMHLTELKRLAEGYTENDAIVISQVLAKNYPMAMFSALNDEYSNMKKVVDSITGAIINKEDAGNG